MWWYMNSVQIAYPWSILALIFLDCIQTFTSIMIKIATVSTFALAASAFANHAAPSSLIQLEAVPKPADADSVLGMIQTEVSEFQKQMGDEVNADNEQVRKLKDQQRKMDRDEKAFKARIFTRRDGGASSAFLETGNHFGDPFIDEAMRTLGDEIDSQKRELETIVASHHAGPAALVQESQKRPELGLIASALKTRLAMVGKN